MATSLDNRGGQLNLRFFVGETWDDSIFLKDENQDAIDITGNTVQMVIYDGEESGNVLYTWSSPTNFTITGPEGKITAAKYLDTAFCGFYRMKITNPNLTVDSQPRQDIFLYGKFHVY